MRSAEISKTKTKITRSKTTTPKKKAPAKKTTVKKTAAKKTAAAKSTYEELLELAKEYNVDNNAMFLAAAKQYDVQIKVIDLIRKELEEGSPDLIESKEYVKGSPNAYANPLIKELPKHSDSANRTLGTMLDIITKLGKKTEEESGLSKFNKEFS